MSKIISISRIAIIIIAPLCIVGGTLFVVGCDFFNQETTVDNVINCGSESESKDTQDHSYQKREPFPQNENKSGTKG